MDTTLKQVGELLLDAVPTVVLLLLLYAIYQNLVRKPLERILAGAARPHRGSRAEGACRCGSRRSAHPGIRTEAARRSAGNLQGAGSAASAGAAVAGTGYWRKPGHEPRSRSARPRLAIEQDMARREDGTAGRDSSVWPSDIIRTILKPAGTAPAAGGAQ